MAKRLMMVLNDGETYTDLHGCMIVEIDDAPQAAQEFYEEDESVRAVAAGQGYGHIITVFTDPTVF